MSADFFTAEEQEEIVSYIRAAELRTSGEVKVHIEPYCKTDPMFRAQQLFEEIGLTHTRDRNGVLIYVAYQDHKFAILGDKGIHDKVGQEFWDSTRDAMREHFSQGKFAKGLCAGIEKAGTELKKLFPYREDDQNELEDSISFGG